MKMSKNGCVIFVPCMLEVPFTIKKNKNKQKQTKKETLSAVSGSEVIEKAHAVVFG